MFWQKLFNLHKKSCVVHIFIPNLTPWGLFPFPVEIKGRGEMGQTYFMFFAVWV